MTPSQQAPSLVERLNDPIAHDRETTVQLICRWRTERREAAARITELEGFAQSWHRAVETILTIAGLSPALGATEAAEAMRERLARAERAEAQCRVLQRIVDLARELVSPAGMVNRGVDRGLVVVEKADKSDPHYRLCAALDALSLSGGGGREEKGSLPESPSADAGPYPRSHDDQRSDGGRG